MYRGAQNWVISQATSQKNAMQKLRLRNVLAPCTGAPDKHEGSTVFLLN
jgi:hypothetical protein